MTTGPRITPTRPKANNPPREPSISRDIGIPECLRLSSGRRMLSEELTTRKPHARRKIPDHVIPWNSR